MANRERGEAAIEINGKTYTLLINMNTLAEFEGALSTGLKEYTWKQGFHLVQREQFKAVRALLWAALQPKHPQMSIEAVGLLIQEMGGTQNIEAKLGEAMKAMLPTAEDAGAGRPQQARRTGRGEPSTSGPDASGSDDASSGI